MSITDPLREFGGQFYEGTNPNNLRFMDIFLALDSLADDIDRKHERAIQDAKEEAKKE